MRLVEHKSAARESRTVLDRVVGWFSPKAGLDRMRHRMQLSAATGDSGGYRGGRRDRRATRYWRPGGGSADADILPDLPDLRARARDLARNTPIATGAINTVVTNVVGDGLQLQAALDHEALGLTEAQADAFEREQEREWAVFCRSCDFTRVQHFDEIQAMAFRAVLDSGDVLIVRRYRADPGCRYGTRLQVIEADRLSNPGRAADSDTIAGGVEVDGDGVPQAYHISDRHPGNLRSGKLNWSRLEARTKQGLQSVLHLFDRTRPEQTRGIPYLAPIVETIKQLGDYTDAEVTAAVVSALYTGFITTKAGEDDTSTPIAGEADTATPSSLASNELKLGAGAMIGLAEGEDIKFSTPGRPNAEFDPFVQAVCRQMGVALELPFELLIKHFTASYSASRAALEMAWQFFRRRRSWLAWRLNQVAYEWFMDEAVASGQLNRPGYFEDETLRLAWLGSEWIGPSRISLDPKKEAEADEIDVRNGVKTREQICLERTGGQWEDKQRQLEKEQDARKAAGMDQQPQASNDPNAKQGAPREPDDDEEDDDEEQPQRGRA